MINVLLVDDHYLFAQALQSMFHLYDGISIVDTTSNGKEAPALLLKHRIDVILMDISMPDIDGIETIQLIQEKGYRQPVLMLTMHADYREIRMALDAGAMGYLLKDASKHELTEAIRTVYKRQNYFHPKVQKHASDYFKANQLKGEIVEGNPLSEMEKTIIICITKGMDDREIAKQLGTSLIEERKERNKLMQKLGTQNNTELVRFAMEKGIS